MTDRAVVVGSGAGGSVAAMVLARAGREVVVLERGPQHFATLDRLTGRTNFSSDELKALRRFEYPDSLSEPRTFVGLSGIYTGSVNPLPATVGGGTVHWDGKTPRFWDIDFAKRELLGPMQGAAVRDWPFDYVEIAGYYDEIEELLGVQGDAAALMAGPAGTHAPRAVDFPMRAGPAQYSSRKLSDAAADLGLRPFSMPSAVNSRPFGDRPACSNCGFCEGYGCVTNARGSALIPLSRAVAGGAAVLSEHTAIRVCWQGRRATGVEVADPVGGRKVVAADLVVLAGSAVETCRLALRSELPNPHDLIGRHLMFHWYTTAFGSFIDERLHAYRGRSHTHAFDDFADPNFPGARAAAVAAGLPYLRGGIVELGSSPMGPVAEGHVYRRLLPELAPEKPFGHAFKQLMRASLLRERLAAVQMCGEDLAQPQNRVTLDPGVRDYLGEPVARVSFTPSRHELAAQQFFLPKLAEVLQAAGAAAVTALPETRSVVFPAAPGRIPRTSHALGGMWMGTNPTDSVTDGVGRFHDLDNLVVADGSVFPTAGGHNPTLTLMATALRNARAWL